jgi:hypothetical protein
MTARRSTASAMTTERSAPLASCVALSLRAALGTVRTRSAPSASRIVLRLRAAMETMRGRSAPAAGVARLLCAVMVVALGCAPAAAPPPAAPKGPTACERASDSMVGAMLARLPASDEPTEAADALRNLIRERCEKDAWSDEATRCLIAMKKLDDAAPCAKLMTEDQQAALVRDEEARFGGAPGGESGGSAEKPAESGGPGKPAGAGSGAPGDSR